MFIVFISTHFIMSLFKPKKRVSATTVTAKKVLSKPIDASLILKIDRRLLEEIFGKDIYEKLDQRRREIKSINEDIYIREYIRNNRLAGGE